MALAEGAHARLAHRGEHLGEDVVEVRLLGVVVVADVVELLRHIAVSARISSSERACISAS